MTAMSPFAGPPVPRSCGRRRPRPRRVPLLEPLEDRTLLAATFDFSGGVASYRAALAGTLTVAQTGDTLRITDSAGPITLTDAARRQGCGGDGSHTVLCPAAGLDQLVLTLPQGEAVTVRTWGLTAAVNVRGPGGLTALTVDDTGHPTARTATLLADQVLGLGAPVSYSAGNLASLTVNGGADGTLQDLGNGVFELTVPIDISLSTTVSSQDVTLHITGSLQASA
jgi:hypothetical protein